MLLQLERPVDIDPPIPLSRGARAIERVTLERLRESGYGALRGVSCLAAHEMLVLEGRLPSYYLKQVAQEIAMKVGGKRRVVNRITVAKTLPPAGRLSF